MGDKKKKAVVVFHRVDYDGLFSYAIARRELELQGYEVEGVGYNYRDENNFSKYDRNKYGKFVVCDITLPCDEMIEMDSRFEDDFIWIDHHITAIEDSEKYKYNGVDGIRETGKAACVLTWEYFHPSEEVPYSVRLAGAHDIWDKTTYDWDNVVSTFQLGLANRFVMNSAAFYEFYDKVIGESDIEDIIDDGKCIKKYTDGLFDSWVKKYSFEVTVGGIHKAICMVCPVFSSKVFDSVGDRYELYVVCEKNGLNEGVYNVSMYSDGKDMDFSCGEYMKEHYHGGGHKGAAGGTMTEEEFFELLTKHTM